MTWQGWLQIVLFCVLSTATVKPLGSYIARSLAGEGRVVRALAPIEKSLYLLGDVDPAKEHSWVEYALALLWFHLAGIIALFALQRTQCLLPLNPQQFDAVGPDLALNTAVSFATNTSWQSYGGETTLSYLTQMAGIAVQSFLSGASGIAVAIALARGFSRRSSRTIGNFWVDLTRITLYVLLPIHAFTPVRVNAARRLLLGPHRWLLGLWHQGRDEGVHRSRQRNAAARSARLRPACAHSVAQRPGVWRMPGRPIAVRIGTLRWASRYPRRRSNRRRRRCSPGRPMGDSRCSSRCLRRWSPLNHCQTAWRLES